MIIKCVKCGGEIHNKKLNLVCDTCGRIVVLRRKKIKNKK